MRLLLDRLVGFPVRSLLAGILVALAALSWVPSASAATSFSITGSNLPGTNTYSIVFSYDADDFVQGYATSVTTTGTYTGAFTRTAPPPFNADFGPGVVADGQTGVVSRWVAVSGGVNGPGGTFTIGTIDITVAAGNSVSPIMVGILDGVVVSTGGITITVAPDSISGLTIVPEPTAAALLGLGLLGLAVDRKRRR